MLSDNIDYFKSKPVNIPKTTILLDNGYHPDKLMEELKKISVKSSFFIGTRSLQTSPARVPSHDRLPESSRFGSQTSASLIQALKDLKWVL